MISTGAKTPCGSLGYAAPEQLSLRRYEREVDLWACGGQSYMDLATLGQLTKHTTGTVYHYPNFSDVTMGEKLSRDLQHSLTREQGWEAVMRVRVSRGLRISAFHGHFFIRGTDLLALPNVDEDKTFAVEIAHEENAQNVSNCCLQAALLYTTSDGERDVEYQTTLFENHTPALYDVARINIVSNDLACESDYYSSNDQFKLIAHSNVLYTFSPGLNNNATLIGAKTLIHRNEFLNPVVDPSHAADIMAWHIAIHIVYHDGSSPAMVLQPGDHYNVTVSSKDYGTTER